MTAATLTPSYTAGTWDIDPVHSDVSFSVRHMMVSKVRGRFGSFSGQIATGEDITGSSVTATIDATSIDTNNEQRDNHIRSADFFDVANHPTWTFVSSAVRADDDELFLDGELTIKGVTRPVTMQASVEGAGEDPWGAERVGIRVRGKLDRKDFGLTWQQPLAKGGVLVGEEVRILIDVSAVRAS